MRTLPRNNRRLIGILLAIGLIGALPDGVSADARTEARRHFRRGMELVVEGRTDEGVAELELAYEILPHPNVLYNIGRAYAEAGRYDEALEYFEQYLGSDPPDREEVRAIVTAINQRIEARQLAEAEAQARTAQQATEPQAGEAGTAPTGPTIRASAAEVQALRDAAGQIATLGEVSGSDTLRQRARRLAELADQLEQGATQQAAGGTTTAAAGGTQVAGGAEAAGGAQVAAGVTPTGEGLAIAASQEGGTYEETVVSSSRSAQSPLDAASSTTIITRQDIRMTGITHLGELLRRVAGVQVVNTTGADTDITIRGFNRLISPRLVMLINGRSTYLDPLGITIWGAQPVNVEDIERIEVIRGPASALYGANSFTGLVNIITRDPGERASTEFTAGAGNANQYRVTAATNGRTGDLAYRVSAGYNIYDRFALPFNPSRVDVQIPPRVNFDQGAQTVMGRVDLRYRVSDKLRLNVEGGGVQAVSYALLATGGLTNMAVSGPNAYALASLESEWINLRTFYNFYDYRAAQVDGAIAPFHIRGNTYDAELEFAHVVDIGVPNDIHAGVGYRFKQVEWGLMDQPDISQNTFNVYFDDTLKFSDSFRFNFSLRMDTNPLLPRPVFSPRAAFIVRPDEDQSIRISGTSAFRIPSFTEGYLNLNIPTPAASAVGAIGYGSVPAESTFGRNPINPERIVTAELGYLNQESDYYNFEITAYYNRVWDIMELGVYTQPFTLANYGDPQYQSVANYDPAVNRFAYGASLLTNSPHEYNQYGGEAMFRAYPVDGLDLWANYSLNITMYADGFGPISGDYDRRQPRHMFNAGVQYRSPFGLDVGMDFHVNAKTIWPEIVTTPTGVTYVPLENPAYYMINGRIAYRFWEDRLEVGVVGYNITNTKARQHPMAAPTPARVMGTVALRF